MVTVKMVMWKQHNGTYSTAFIATTAPKIPSMCGSQD